jgi:hypothetical protein
MRPSTAARTLGLTGFAFALVGLAAPARADAIDGDWCFSAQHMLVEGSSITTPARNKVTGNYTRYRVTYVVPPGEPGAGTQITMVMIRGEEMVHLTRAGKEGPPEVWRRCKPIS